MTIEQIFSRPITTPDYPDPTEVRRYIDDPYGFFGFDYVFIEDAAWNALCEIANERGCAVAELCKDIEFDFTTGEGFKSAARLHVLRYIKQIPYNIELPGNFPVLRQLLARWRDTITDKSTVEPAPDPEFDAKVADYRRRCFARIAAIKRDLQHHLDETTHPIGDYVVVSTALLELACERYLETHEDAVEAADFIQTVFRRVVSRRNGSLQ